MLPPSLFMSPSKTGRNFMNLSITEIIVAFFTADLNSFRKLEIICVCPIICMKDYSIYLQRIMCRKMLTFGQKTREKAFLRFSLDSNIFGKKKYIWCSLDWSVFLWAFANQVQRRNSDYTISILNASWQYYKLSLLCLINELLGIFVSASVAIRSHEVEKHST